MMTCPSKPWLTVRCPCCSAALRAVRLTQETCSTCTAACLERAAKVIADDGIAKDMNDLPESIRHMVKGGWIIDRAAHH